MKIADKKEKQNNILLPTVEIIRLEDNFPQGTFGALLVARQVVCWTLEPPEYENKKDFACIPVGQYECERINSLRFKTSTYIICNVPNRTHVEFHPGNTVDDTVACVLLGETQGKLKCSKGDRAVLNSGKTFKNFIEMMSSYEKFNLTIKEAWA